MFYAEHGETLRMSVLSWKLGADLFALQEILVIGSLVIGKIATQATKSSVSTFPRQIVFVTGTSTPRYRHTKEGNFLPVSNYDVIKRVDVIGYRG